MRFDTLAGWLNWQEQLHPSSIELGLARVEQVYQALQLSPVAGVVVTVAGTNGKGSSAAMLESIYRAAGYRVGRYSSPHLLRYTERVMVDGVEVGEQALCEAFERIDQARAGMSLTYFEFGTLAALDIFSRAALDVVVLEVGMGGRLDAVNIIDPDVALITNVGLDHQQWLGPDRESIGYEKAGVMRCARPVVYGELDIPASVLAHVAATGAELYLHGRDFDGQLSSGSGWRWQGGGRSYEALPFPALRASVQLVNAANVLMVVELLQSRLPVARQHIREGLLSVQVAGRMQVVSDRPLCILDVAHNAESVQALAESLRAMPCDGRTFAVVGMLADKDISAALTQMLGVVDDWFAGSLGGDRGAPATRLVEALVGQQVKAFDSVSDAFTAAMAVATEQDRVVVFGSFLTVAEIMGSLASEATVAHG